MGVVKVTSIKELAQGKMVGIEAGNKPILVANLESKYFAIGNRCTHVNCMLSDGVLMGESVQCACHGSVFDVRTGNVLKGPAKKSEPVFQVKVEGDQALVNV
jgi:nitrite reductase/ring-hydroxylating ferredoxin subunit